MLKSFDKHFKWFVIWTYFPPVDFLSDEIPEFIMKFMFWLTRGLRVWVRSNG